MATQRCVTLQVRGGATARVAVVRVAASLGRCDGAAAMLRWRVEPTSCFGEPIRWLRCSAVMMSQGRRLRYSKAMASPGQRLRCSAAMARAEPTATEQKFLFVFFIFYWATSTASFTHERKRTTNSSTRKYAQEKKSKRKPERERKRKL